MVMPPVRHGILPPEIEHRAVGLEARGRDPVGDVPTLSTYRGEGIGAINDMRQAQGDQIPVGNDAFSQGLGDGCEPVAVYLGITPQDEVEALLREGG